MADAMTFLGAMRFLVALLVAAACTGGGGSHDHHRPPRGGDDALPGDSDAPSDDEGAPGDPSDGDMPADDDGDARGDDDPPTEPFALHGRFDTRDEGGPRCAWTGCGFSTRLRGTKLDLSMVSTLDLAYQVVIDGVPTTSFLATAATTYRVADGLSDSDHDVVVYRKSEAFFGITQFRGFVVQAGSVLLGVPAPPTRRLEIIGDSISAGYGNEGCPFATTTENGYLTYGAIAGRAVGADVHIEAWSGIGMVRDGGGDTTNVMPPRFELALPEDDESTWDFASWVPDAVVVNLGTNDFASGNAGQAFVDAYTAFVVHLRDLYPGAFIFCAVHQGMSPYVDEIDTVLATVGDVQMSRLDFQVPDWSGCDGHPTVTANQAMATTLIQRLNEELGW